MEKLKRQLAEADAAVEARKKPPVEAGPRVAAEGLVIDEWVSKVLSINYSLSMLFYTFGYVFILNCSLMFTEREKGKVLGPATSSSSRFSVKHNLFFQLILFFREIQSLLCYCCRQP